MRNSFNIAAALVAVAAPSNLSAQIVVSANDGKQLRAGEAPSTRTPDTVSVIDLRAYPPRTIGTTEAPTSMIGPPSSVALARSGSFALVTAAQRLSATGEIELNDALSLIDLEKPTAPKLVQTVHAGPGASGVTINRAGTLALVASTADDAIWIFSISNKRLTPAGKVQLPAKSRPTDVVFAPSGNMALVAAQGANQLVRLAVSGDIVSITGVPIPTGVQPYGVLFSPDGRYAYTNTLLGPMLPPDAPRTAGPRTGTVAAVDLATDTVASIDVGITPEHVGLSRDGKFMAVVIANGSMNAPESPTYHSYGLLRLYGVAGTAMTPVAETRTSGWCQGAIFSDDGRSVLLQCAIPRTIEIFRFDGKSLRRDDKSILKFHARPGSFATATSR